MPHLQVQCSNTIDLILGYFPSSVLQELHRLLDPFQRKILFLGFGTLHVLVPHTMVMTGLNENLRLMVFLVQNHSYKVKHSQGNSKEFSKERFMFSTSKMSYVSSFLNQG